MPGPESDATALAQLNAADADAKGYERRDSEAFVRAPGTSGGTPKGYASFPRLPRFPSRKFRRWVRAFGVMRLARALGQDPKVIASWLHPRGGRLGRARPYPPRLTTAWTLLRLSRRRRCGIGPLDWHDLYGRP